MQSPMLNRINTRVVGLLWCYRGYGILALLLFLLKEVLQRYGIG